MTVYISVIVLGTLSIITLYIYRLENTRFLNEKKDYFSNYYSTNLKISLEDKSIRIIDDKCIIKKIDNVAITKDKKIIKNINSFTIMDDKEFKELLTIISNSATRNKHTFKANFSILSLLLAFGIALLNLSFSQPSNNSLNSINSSVSGLIHNVDSISIENKDDIQNIMAKVQNEVYEYKTESYTLISSSLDDLQDEIKKLSTIDGNEDKQTKQIEQIKKSNEILEDRLNNVIKEKNNKIEILFFYCSIIYIFYLILVFTASYIEKFLNKDSIKQQLLADILNGGYLLKINQSKKT